MMALFFIQRLIRPSDFFYNHSKKEGSSSISVL